VCGIDSSSSLSYGDCGGGCGLEFESEKYYYYNIQRNESKNTCEEGEAFFVVTFF
jgi:hypothetical protein